MVRILSFLTCRGAASWPPLPAGAARSGPRGNGSPITWAVRELPIRHVIFTRRKGKLFTIIFVLLLLSQPTLGSFKCPQQNRTESYHLQSGPRMEVIFWAQPSKLEKLPLKSLCSTAHLEPHESIFSPGKLKQEDTGKEHIHICRKLQCPWAVIFCQAHLTFSQAEACCTCIYIKQKGTTHGRISPVKEEQAIHWLLKLGNKSFPASPVPWSLNGMLCPVVLSAM